MFFSARSSARAARSRLALVLKRRVCLIVIRLDISEDVAHLNYITFIHIELYNLAGYSGLLFDHAFGLNLSGDVYFGVDIAMLYFIEIAGCGFHERAYAGLLFAATRNDLPRVVALITTDDTTSHKNE